MPAKATPPWMGALSKAFAPTCPCLPKICQLVAMATQLAYEERLDLPELLKPYAHERPAGAQAPAAQAARQVQVAAMQKATEELGATEDRYLKLELKKTRTEQETQEMGVLPMEDCQQVREVARLFLQAQVAQVPGFWARQAREQHEGKYCGLSDVLGWTGEECWLCFVCHATRPCMTANGVLEQQVGQLPSVITGKTAQKHLATKNAGGHSAHASAYELRRATEAREQREAKEQQEWAQEQGKRQGKQELLRKQVKRQDKNKRWHEWAERTQATGETRPVQDKDVLDPRLLDGDSTCTELTEENVRARTRQRARVADSGGADVGGGGGGGGASSGAGATEGDEGQPVDKRPRYAAAEEGVTVGDEQDVDMVSQVADLGRVEDVDSEDLDSGADSDSHEEYEDPNEDPKLTPVVFNRADFFVPQGPSSLFLSEYGGFHTGIEHNTKTAIVNAATYASMQH
eukprot:COSAG01_NODE_2342_length_7868_cov_104.618484_4_plen_460_part_00